jgi:BTB/POZ domain
MMSSDEITNLRAKLINNAATSPDVTFLVGPTARKVTAHKLFLVSASPVFKAMFSENFASDAEIEIPDVEEDAFIQVKKNHKQLLWFVVIPKHNKFQILVYCYTLKATICENNMLEVLYAAQKYMLSSLMELCAKYVLERTTQTNCLVIFNVTHLLSCPAVNSKCQNYFQESPWNFFKDASFLKLSLSALKNLAGLPIMNCTGYDMKSAVISWFVENGHCKSVEDMDDEMLYHQGFAVDNFGVKEFTNLTRTGSHAMEIQIFKINTTNILVSHRMLHGVGLCIGGPGIQNDELVKLTISHDQGVFSVERSVQKSLNLAIVEVMFEKPALLSGTVTVEVEFNTAQPRAVITNFLGKELRNSYYAYNGQQNWDRMWAAEAASPFTCLAYMIYANK